MPGKGLSIVWITYAFPDEHTFSGTFAAIMLYVDVHFSCVFCRGAACLASFGFYSRRSLPSSPMRPDSGRLRPGINRVSPGCSCSTNQARLPPLQTVWANGLRQSNRMAARCRAYGITTRTGRDEHRRHTSLHTVRNSIITYTGNCTARRDITKLACKRQSATYTCRRR